MNTHIDVVEYAGALAQDLRDDYGATVDTIFFSRGRPGDELIRVHITTDSSDFKINLRCDGRGKCTKGSVDIGGPDLDEIKAEVCRRIRAELAG